MTKRNWNKSRKRHQLNRLAVSLPVRARRECKLVPVGTNVQLRSGVLGRVVDHKNGLNVVIDASGTVIGLFATQDLVPASSK